MSATSIASNIEWKKWGEEDPLYGVASWKGKAKGETAPWTDSDFYTVGQSDWQDALRHWERYGLRKRRCVEIGCGAGRLTMHMAQSFKEVHALDVLEGMLAYARAQVNAPSATFHLTSGGEIPLPDQSVDAVFSAHVFQHLDPVSAAEDYFAEIARVLLPGGTVMIHLPIYQWPTMPRVFDLLYRLRKTLGGWKASMQRRLIARGLAKPIMRMTSFRLDYIFETLPTYGLTDIEIKLFSMTSNRDPHPFIFARKAR